MYLCVSATLRETECPVPRLTPRATGRCALLQGERHVGHLRAANIEGDDHAVEGARRLHPVAFGVELRGVADGLAGGGIGHGLERERTLLAADVRHDFERGGLDADEVLGVGVEHVGAEPAGIELADEL
jgi:hypothetical protein